MLTLLRTGDTERPSSSGAVITTVEWIGIAATAWMVLAVLVGVLVGRMIRRRDLRSAVEHDGGSVAGPGAGRLPRVPGGGRQYGS